MQNNNIAAYKRCLELMKKNSQRVLQSIKEIYDTGIDQDCKELIAEAARVEMESLAFAHFNLAQLENPGIMKHYPADRIESEGASNDNDTTRS